MKKSFRKALSLFLSVALCASVFAGMPLSASAAGTVTLERDDVTGLSVQNFTDANVYMQSTFDCTEFATRKTDNLLAKGASALYNANADGSKGSAIITPDSSKCATLYDGDMITHSTACWFSGTNPFLNSYDSTREKALGYIVFSLDAAYTINNIYLIGAGNGNNNGTFTMHDYDLYVSNTENDLFADANKVITYTADSTVGNLNTWTPAAGYNLCDGQEFKFSGSSLPVGKYVGVRIVRSATNNSYPNYHFLQEAGIEGTPCAPVAKDVDIDYISDSMFYYDVPSGTEVELKDVIGNDADGKPLADKNLIKDAKISLNAYTAETKSSVSSGGPDDSAFAKITDGKLGDKTEGYNPSGLFGGNLSAKTCKNYGDGVYSWETEHKYSYDYIISLKNYSTISAVVIGSCSTCPIGDHDIYISGDKDTLFSGDPVASYVMDTDKWIVNRDADHKASSLGVNVWKTKSETTLVGQYVGIRVWIGNATPKTNSGNAPYWFDRMRMNEFAVYGEKINSFSPAGYDKSDLVEVVPESTLSPLGEPYKFKLVAYGEAKITSVVYKQETLTPDGDVYTIEDTATAPETVYITTDKDDTSPKNGQWNGVDLTTRKSAAGNALWNNAVSVHETAFFYDALGKQRHEVSLLYPIDDVIQVRSYDLKTVYYEGKDYTVTADGKLKLTENTTIPIYGDDPSETDDIRCIVNGGSGGTDWAGEGRWCNRTWQYQIDVTYTHTKTWGKNAMYEKGVEDQSAALKKFYDKAASGEDTHVLFLGDSITEGLLATACDIQAYTYKNNEQILGPSDVTSRYTRASHFSSKYTLDEIKEWGGDSFATQVGEALTAKLGSNVTYVNRGVGATNTQWTWNNIKFLAGPADPSCNPVGTPTPDLAFIAFGTNESGNGYSYTKTKFTQMIDYLRTLNPDCCVVLVSAFYANRYDNNGKLVCYTSGLGEQERAAKDLASELSGVAYAPVWSMFKSMIDDEADGTNYNGTKQVFDYMGDMCNHPNDFGHTVYASTILSAMGLDEITAKPQAVETTENSITLDNSTPLLYKMNDGKWQTNCKFEGLEKDTEYTFYAASPTSLISEKAVIKTLNPHQHQFAPLWNCNDTHHWHICTVDGCDEKSDYAEHEYDNACDENCNVCGLPREVTHKNTTVKGKIAATCEKAGYSGDTYCKDCGKLLSKGSKISALGHKNKTTTTKATYFAKGKKVTKCSTCGKTTTVTIKKLTLKTPKVKITAKKKSLSVKLTKVSGQTGFKVRYRLKGKSKWTTKTFKTKKSVTKVIKSLKAKKNYQLQVCAYVTSGKKPATSKWSKTYTKKTK